MWYLLTVIFLLISLFVGYRMTLIVDKFLEREGEDDTTLVKKYGGNKQ